MLLRGRFAGFGAKGGVASSAGVFSGITTGVGGITGLKIAFFFPLDEEEDIMEVVCGLLSL